MAARAAISAIPGGRVANKSHLHGPPDQYGRLGRIRLHRHSEDTAVVYVCLCNALTDRQVKQAAAAAGTVRPSMIYAACGCRAQCGQCVKALVLLLRGPDPAMPEPRGAD
jgi:bacterioferritin-associated ferredoxin